MTPIQSQVQQVASVLRTQLASLRAPLRGIQQSRQKQDAVATPAGSDSSAPPDLADVLAKRVQQISADDPKYKKKVLRVFLESIFSAEFGESFANDLRFSQMVESVQQQMEADPQLGALVDQVVASLTSAKR